MLHQFRKFICKVGANLLTKFSDYLHKTVLQIGQDVFVRATPVLTVMFFIKPLEQQVRH